MFYVNRIVGWCLSPLGVLFLGLAFAWLIRSRRISVWIAGLVLGVTWLLGCGITTRLIGLPLEVDEVDESTLPSADAIVLLGGGMGVHEKCGRMEMYSSADRVWMAARLYKAGKAPVMFVTGTNNVLSTTGLLVDFGVPTNALRYLDAARNTEEEARALVEVLSPSRTVDRSLHCSPTPSNFASNKPKVLLVTSAWHMKRAKMMFEKYAPGLEVVAAPTDYEMHAAVERPIGFGDFLPGAETMSRNGYALKEWVARFGYWAFR